MSIQKLFTGVTNNESYKSINEMYFLIIKTRNLYIKIMEGHIVSIKRE